MPDDPIERFTTEVEVYGIPQPAGAPPLTEAYFHVRYRPDGNAERAKLGLPAYEGKQGPPGPPGAVHQGDRTSAQLTALQGVLGPEQVNYSYRNTDTNDQYVWDGESFVVYQDVYQTPGPPGPAPNLSAGTLTVGGEQVVDPDFGVRVTGTNPNYVVDVDLPQLPKGDKGDVGPSGSVYTSVDVDQTVAPNDGDVLVHDADAGKLVWSPGQFVTEEYVVPPSGFPNASKSSSDLRHLLVTLLIPAKPYRYRFDFSGGVDVESKSGHQIDLEVRSNLDTPTSPETNGPLVGYGKGQDGEGWREVAFRAHSDVAIDPSSHEATVPPGTPVTLYVSAVKKAGILLGWSVRNTRAQLRVRLLRVN
ncbi:minor tail protein [Gordonia phage Ghobes]|uniref:Minor tail protein n=1 Tax=Gordonia phage Ghobes TaxID=1887647 RepID=A0A1B3B030_9CAUD|nr:minor tail protein [Gordonia phage Ghobes]AOE44377.1 minor tail protein [Gordonia phage Ghobes]